MKRIILFVAFAFACFAGTAAFAEDSGQAAGAGSAEAPKLEGVVVERASGGFLTLTMNGPRIVIRFFDKDKKPIAPDVENGFARFQMSNRTPERRPLTRSEDGMSLTHGQPLRPPFAFKAFITLRRGEGDENVETHVIDYP